MMARTEESDCLSGHRPLAFHRSLTLPARIESPVHAFTPSPVHPMPHPWLASRTAAFDSSGIRKVFDLAAKMKDPINLSIGQPDFDVPEPIKEACIEAIRTGKNAYTVTQGVPALRDKLQARVDQQF